MMKIKKIYMKSETEKNVILCTTIYNIS